MLESLHIQILAWNLTCPASPFFATAMRGPARSNRVHTNHIIGESQPVQAENDTKAMLILQNCHGKNAYGLEGPKKARTAPTLVLAI